MNKPNQIPPNLRPHPPLTPQTLIHNTACHDRNVPVCKTIPLNVLRTGAGDGVDGDSALVSVGPAAVDPGVRELSLVEIQGIGVAGPFIEVRVGLGFGKDGSGEFKAPAEGWKAMEWVFADGGGGSGGREVEEEEED